MSAKESEETALNRIKNKITTKIHKKRETNLTLIMKFLVMVISLLTTLPPDLLIVSIPVQTNINIWNHHSFIIVGGFYDVMSSGILGL